MKALLFDTKVYEQVATEGLVQQALDRNQAKLSSTGALMIRTGKFTGRSPEDKYIVRDAITNKHVDWNKFNNPLGIDAFVKLKDDMLAYLNQQPELWGRNMYASADPAYQLHLRIVTETPWANHFAANMFIEPAACDLFDFQPQWQILQAPGFHANPSVHGTRSNNFTIVSFEHQLIMIGGSGYTGEIKKSVFTILNFLLPFNHQVLSMHCSANEGEDGDVALFFGLSGTGKTTLSADSHRKLIGDDEHGWGAHGVFNFEGGCYAKIINLSPESEPEIYSAIREGALVENAVLHKYRQEIDFADKTITENTRVSYPLEFISNAKHPATGGHPTNIFFLSCDASGVLPPISKLDKEQAMYYFLNGYTAKVAGTEAGVKEPKITFSTCFGAPFLPLHPEVYAGLLGKKMAGHDVNVWLVNTGWTGGPYGTGERMRISYTRAMVRAALAGKLNGVEYVTHPILKLMMPVSCPEVDNKVLNPRNTWSDPFAYDEAATKLAAEFQKNFVQFHNMAVKEVALI